MSDDGMTLAEKIREKGRAHFAGMEVRTFEVAEWGSDDAPAVIYCKPLTLQQRGTIKRRAKDDDIKTGAIAVMLYALDKDGNKIFEDSAAQLKEILTEYDPKIIGNIARFILDASDHDDLKE